MRDVKKIIILRSRWDTTWYKNFIGNEFLVREWDQWGHLYQVVNEDLYIDARDCIILDEKNLQPIKNITKFNFN